MAMLYSIRKTAIRITAIALLAASATFGTNAVAAPTGDDACLTSPASINHTPCTNGGN
jgi:hypothetical protein